MLPIVGGPKAWIRDNGTPELGFADSALPVAGESDRRV